MVLMMILEYKNAEVFSCFTVSHSLQQSVFFPDFGSKNQEVLIAIEVTIRVTIRSLLVQDLPPPWLGVGWRVLLSPWNSAADPDK